MAQIEVVIPARGLIDRLLANEGFDWLLQEQGSCNNQYARGLMAQLRVNAVPILMCISICLGGTNEF
jgi:hypothetical protein